MNYFSLFAQTSSSQLNADEAAAGVAAAGIGIVFLLFWLAFIAFAIAGLVFWLISLIHVLQHQDVKDRVMRIVILLVAGNIAGIIYFFAVKRPYDSGGMREVPPVNPS